MAEEKKVDVGEKMEEVSAKEDSSSSSAMRFEIKKWNAVTMWSWDICADTCAICRNSLNEPSIEYQVRLTYDSPHTSHILPIPISPTPGAGEFR
jgi:hypothetical protein